MSKIVTGCLMLVCCLLVSGNASAGWQRDMVCGGRCGGACGPCTQQGPDREDRVDAAYGRQVALYNELQAKAHAAARAGDPAEAIRLAREALAVLDDEGLRGRIRMWESQILIDRANSTTDLRERIELVRRALAIHDYKEAREWLNQAQAGLKVSDLYDQGMSAFNSGDYALAKLLFEQAQEADPNPAYAENVRLATAKLTTKREVSQLTENIVRRQNAAAASTSGLDFMPAESATTGVFGTTSNPSDPDLVTSTDGPAVAVESALKQLSSVAESGEDAKNAAKREDRKELSDCGFGNTLCREPAPLVGVATPAGTAEGASDLVSHIPDGAKEDPVIRASIAWFEKLEMRQAETKRKMDDFRKEIDSGVGDQVVLKAKSAALENDLKRNGADQEAAKDQIKKRLVDLSLEWDESPEQKD